MSFGVTDQLTVMSDLDVGLNSAGKVVIALVPDVRRPYAAVARRGI